MPTRTSPLVQFLSSVHAVRCTGEAVPETSYYPAISRLLEDTGMSLSPRVRPVINIRNRGSGIPDGGLFLARRTGPVNADNPMAASAPERGALEVKPPSQDLARVSGSAQVRRYVERYGKVLVTTMREWGLVTHDRPSGRVKRVDSFSIAPTEEAFWGIAGAPADYCAANEEQFARFLKRALEYDAPLSNPPDLAWLLAAHARMALARIEDHELPDLDRIRRALADALELSFEGEKGEHFFRSTLVQTLFYGVFSAWVLWHRSAPPPDQRFTWRQAAWELKVPMVSTLFEQISVPSIMRQLNVEELMDWTDDALARVDRIRFFERFEEDKAVQYFYEPFLQYFDAALREQYGVWYTPPEVVKYMVERVDQLLVGEFGFGQGLADERVIVLDPCVGTGSYLIAVLNKIAQRLPDDALAAQDIKTAARTRIFGFEVLPAPFVVAHLQLGLLLARVGAPLEEGERAAIYLTNSLTGWQDDNKPPGLPFPEFESEREAAHTVKREERIVVVLGNPPYYPFSGVSSAEETNLIEPYKKGIVTRNSLNDLYVRFYRVAERRIVDGTGYGIVCFITNFSYLHEPGFVEMRRTLLSDFDEIYIDCLNGDSRETGKRTPDGKPDPSIFTSSFNRQGIQVGTAIGTYVRRSPHGDEATVRYRDFWGENKKQRLLESLDGGAEHMPLTLTNVNRMAFRPGQFSVDYESWPQIVELAAITPSLGLNENRGSVLIDPDRDTLEARMRLYLDPNTSWADLGGTEAEPLMRRWARFDPAGTRARLLAVGFKNDAVVRFVSRPLDIQWAYVDPTRKLWNEVRRELLVHAQPGNWFLMVRRRAPRADDGAAMLPASCLGDQHVLHKDAYLIPIRQYLSSDAIADAGQDGLFELGSRPNLSAKAAAYLAELGIADADPDYTELLWWHALAICYAPQYVADNPGGIAADWPRIPLPERIDDLWVSATLGKQLAALLDPLVPVPGLPAVIGSIRRVDGTAIQPARGDLDVRAQWGNVQGTSVFPGRGQSTLRSYTDAEATTLGSAAAQLGEPFDIYLNQETFWSCIPEETWNFKIGGFQVLKKWLSYREHGDGPPLLGRGLTPAEARGFTYLAQRLSAVVMLRDTLNANYLAISEKSAKWS